MVNKPANKPAEKENDTETTGMVALTINLPSTTGFIPAKMPVPLKK